MSKRLIRIGTRGSQLAMWQANWIKEQIEKRHPDIEAKLIRIKTSGDKIRDVPLAKVGGKGLFVKEIEEALMDSRIDLAVHSMKDVPTEIPEELDVKVITKREDARDAFISANGKKLAELPKKAVIGTSSLRRQAQILHFRPDLIMSPLRGNVGTRLRKVRESNLAGVILASAGLKRLGFEDQVTEYLPVSLSLPAIGQGSLGIETRVADHHTGDLVAHMNDQASNIAVCAERSLLKRLEGGCQVPIAAYGRVEDGKIHLEGMVSSLDGQRFLRQSISGSIGNPIGLGVKLAEVLLEMGAKEILSEIYGSSLC